MNERGFVTVFALCLILVVALVVKGIQEVETNHNYATADLQAEFDLQNAADSGIYEAAEIVRSDEEALPENNSPINRKQCQLVTRSTKSLHGTIIVEVWGERLKIQCHKRKYPSYKTEANGNPKDGYVLVSVAQLDSPHFGKMYRRAFAYVVGQESTIHFMEIPAVKDD